MEGGSLRAMAPARTRRDPITAGKMRQLTYVKPNLVEWHDVPAPKLIRADDALVRPIAVARCDLDPMIVTGRTGMQDPFALGHEMVAEIVQLGMAVTGFHPGQRVIVPFQIGCGQCVNCRRGETGSCSEVPLLSAFGMAPLSGVEYGDALSDRAGGAGERRR
jgi:alcohol dehydrogenase